MNSMKIVRIVALLLPSALLAQTNLGPIETTQQDNIGTATPPANPAAGNCRAYFNLTSGLMGWINSSGASCGPSGSGGTISGLSPGVVPQAIDSTHIGNSNPQLDIGVTTAGVITYAGPIASTSPPGIAGAIKIKGDLAPPGWNATGQWGFSGFGSTSAATYYFQPTIIPPTAGQVFTAGSPGTCVTSSDSKCIPLNYSTPSGGGGNPQLENCAPDQTGNSFYNVAALTNYFFGHWEFVFGQASYINCTVFIPVGPGVSKQIILDIAANDAVAGHTANFQTCDIVINSGTINVGAPTCAANQTFTTTSTAYNRVTLTFAVQSTLSNNSILVVKIATSTTGTAPTADMLVYAHFIL